MAVIKFEELEIPGCFRINSNVFEDQRGTFTKTFHRPLFEEQGLDSIFDEDFFSFSHAGVLRGLHFQVPPEEHAKVVFCIHGNVMDVIVDLRVGSPVYGKSVGITLESRSGAGVYIPSGCAHGFFALSDSLMYYKVTSVHSPVHDAGILWNSIDFRWPVEHPLVSVRDSSFPSLSEFQSPFLFERAS